MIHVVLFPLPSFCLITCVCVVPFTSFVPGQTVAKERSCPLKLYLTKRNRANKFVKYTGLTADEQDESGGTDGGKLTCACVNTTEITPVHWSGVDGALLSNSSRHPIYYALARNQPGTAVRLHIKKRHFNCTNAGKYTCVIGNNKRTVTVTPNGRQ